MALIGDYVHYHLKNYRDYGVSKKGGDSSKNAQEAFIQQKNTIQNLVNKEKNFDTKEIEAQLNRYYKRTQNDGGFKPKEQEVLEKAKEILEQRLKTSADKIDYNDISVYANTLFSQSVYQSLQQEFSNEMRALQKNKVGAGKKVVKLSTIERRIRFFQDLQRTLEQQKKTGVVGYSTLVNTLQKIETDFTNIKKGLTQGQTAIPISDNKGFLDTINQLMHSIRGTQAINESGQLAEGLALVMMHMNTLVGATNVELAIQSLLDNLKYNQGKTLNSRGYSVSLYTPDLKQVTKAHGGNAAQLNIDLPGSNLMVSVDAKLTGGKQGKVDISFKSKGNLINASVKNYAVNSDTKIHINAGSNILLAAQQYPYFLNHYLNVMAAHPADANAMTNLSSYRNQAKEAMKLTLLGHSLVGGYITNKGIMNKNDVLILNNKGIGFSVYSMGDILTQASRNIDAFLDLKTELAENLDNTYVEAKNSGKNRNYHSAMVRINNLLNQLKTADATAYLRASALGF